MTAIERIEELLEFYDADVRFELASTCTWCGQLRLTVTNPEDAPSRSVTFYSVGGLAPEDVAERLLADFEVWLRESGTEPMGVPDWMR